MGTRLIKMTAGISYLLLILPVISGCRRAEDSGSTPDVITTQSGLEMVAIGGGWFEM